MALRRQVKNVVKNFSDIEVKVREATSNDPWGPSSSLTAEIADATYNVQAFTETMTLLWKRINDHGKNWRHVYKSLVVLDYIIKTGSERVAQQCRENIFAIKTLKDFQFIDKDGKDQGINVREKSKQLVALLKDEERLKSERQRALKAKERFYQAEGGIGNVSYPKNKKFQGGPKFTESRGSVDDSNLPSRTWPETDQNADSRSTDGRIDSEIEKVRPSNEAEEEMQLQIALAMSREEAEGSLGEEKPPPLENLSLQPHAPQPHATATLLNLTDATPPPITSNENIFDPWGNPQPGPSSMMAASAEPLGHPQPDPWGVPSQPPPPVNTGFGIAAQPAAAVAADPWAPAPVVTPSVDPWSAPVQQPPPTAAQPMFAPAPVVQSMPQPVVPQASGGSDPWGLGTTAPAPMVDPFAPQAGAVGANTMATMDLLNDPTSAGDFFGGGTPPSEPKQNVSPVSSFLANGSHLVNVDNILASSTTPAGGGNPFALGGGGGGGGMNTNPFLQDKPKAKSINEMRNAKTTMFSGGAGDVAGGIAAPQTSYPSNDILLPTPIAPSSGNTTGSGTGSSHNPFL